MERCRALLERVLRAEFDAGGAFERRAAAAACDRLRARLDPERKKRGTVHVDDAAPARRLSMYEVHVDRERLTVTLSAAGEASVFRLAANEAGEVHAELVRRAQVLERADVLERAPSDSARAQMGEFALAVERACRVSFEADVYLAFERGAFARGLSLTARGQPVLPLPNDVPPTNE